MARLVRKRYVELTEDQQATFDKIVENRPVQPQDGHIGGPFDIWLRSPELGQRMVGLGGFFRFRTSVDRRYIELAILVTGAHWQAQFEWYAHEPMARKAGVPDDVIAAIKAGDTPASTDERDMATYQVAHELLNTRKLSEESYNTAVRLFGEEGLAEIIGVTGFYVSVSMTLNAFDVDLPEGAQKPFPD